jgi:DNA-binding CsgD family transcriptional regulator
MARTPLYVRTLTEEEEVALRAGVRSHEAFTLRRCQILLSSASGKRASQIATELGCDTDTALNALNAFNQKGLSALTPGSTKPHRSERGFDSAAAEQ